jgi:hypothetical protein
MTAQEGCSRSQMTDPAYRWAWNSGNLMRLMAALLMGLVAPAFAQQVPALATISETIAASHPDLVSRRASLMSERSTLHGEVDRLNAQCAAVVEASAAEASCKKSREALLSSLNSHIERSNDFNAVVQSAIEANTGRDEGARIISGMNALAKNLGWSTAKQARLANALNSLAFDGDPAATGAEIVHTWRDVLARGEDRELEREASQGKGLGFAGAGQQTRYQDCSIFALANATGLPYSVVAARANELISKGDWHDAAERAAPQAVIERKGLNGGEVVMLAESFGRAQVIPLSDFARSLKEGHPVLVNVVYTHGDVRSGHEVVLTKTFQHAGETWYVMMDSYQGPQRRLFLSAHELSTMLQENGVAFRPEEHTTPQLLH